METNNIVVLDIQTIISAATFVIAVINIFVVLFNWNNIRSRLEFYKPDFRHFYRNSNPAEFNYRGSECLVFCKVMIANCSSMPCTISSFRLVVKGYRDAIFDSNVEIKDKYLLSNGPTGPQYLFSDKFVNVPVVLPPYGYLEGVLVFPYGPMYTGQNIKAVLKARTSKRTFKFHLVLHHQTDMSQFQIYQQ